MYTYSRVGSFFIFILKNAVRVGEVTQLLLTALCSGAVVTIGRLSFPNKPMKQTLNLQFQYIDRASSSSTVPSMLATGCLQLSGSFCLLLHRHARMISQVLLPCSL